MSRIGKKPVPVPSNVTVTVSGQTVKVKGAKGELSFTMPEEIKVEKTAEGIEVTPRDDTKKARSMWGMSRTMVRNLIEGVTDGYTHTLEIHGVGFRRRSRARTLQPSARLQPRRQLHDPGGHQDRGAEVHASRHLRHRQAIVGQIAAEIRAYRKPEPYKGKGVKYHGEHIRRKEGKKK